MIFKIGDKILFKKEKQEGIVLEILSKEKILIRNSNGFDIEVFSNDIILFEEETNSPSAYGSNFPQKDKLTNLNHFKKDYQKVEYKIDLHVEKIIKDYKGMSNFEIVQIQLSVCRRKINELLDKNISKVVIVHGIGAGLLRTEVHNILDEYKLRYYVSRDGGATQVVF